jgi:beta-glucosidase
MANRTYRYFTGEPLWPFGHGLSYTKFEYANLQVPTAPIGAADAVDVSLDVRNTGSRDGHEVVQLYARSLAPAEGAPLKELRGFERVFLKAGESKRVTFRLTPATDLARYDVAAKKFTVSAGEYEVQLAASSTDVRLKGKLTVK